MAKRTVDEIRAELAESRARLVQATEDAVEAVKPQNIARESVAQVKQFAKTEFDSATSQFRDETGAWRRDRLLLIGGAVVGAIVFVATLSSIANRRSISAQARRAIEQ